MASLSLWNRIPLIVRALIAGFAILGFASTMWGGLLVTNLSTSPQFPWAVPAMGFVLWLLWKYLNGSGWPETTSDLRRARLRANSVSLPAWKWALVAGGSAIVALTGLWIVTGNLVKMPPNQLPDMSAYPTYVVVLGLMMASLVAPISEEAGFRGYIQGPLEKNYGPIAAILISSIAFSLAHLTHGAFPPKLFLYFLGGVILGLPAYLTNSILPGIVVHIFADLVFFILVWPGDAGRVLVSQGGADAWFWTHVVQVLAFGLLAIYGYQRLASLPRPLMDTPSPPGPDLRQTGVESGSRLRAGHSR